ncbi:hypothetical protein J4E85_011131 [Alternaria conjuncta]|uniref:uncharacterized protein n=1 Tax=Alternaria conjuncta TaxID=181017 RepID=UPI00221FB9DC|nr:uncharacterized protein J4E85_011131 [Alternaria conjuncta]KAI4912197.1 hypothetical protein J4E85_011131 [Alternaria conjuncta]
MRSSSYRESWKLKNAVRLYYSSKFDRGRGVSELNLRARCKAVMMQQDQPERDGGERPIRRAHLDSHNLVPNNTFATSIATRSTDQAAREKVETVTRKAVRRKRAGGFDQKDCKTPGNPRIVVKDSRYHHATQTDDGYEMRDDDSSPYENDSRNISQDSFDDKEEEMETTERVRRWINEMLLGGYNQASAEPPPGLLAD